MKLLFFILLFFCFIDSFGQSYFNNTLQYGLRSTLLGGSVTAGSEDLSMVYYNPAALSYSKDKAFDLAIILPTIDIYGFGDFFQEGTNTSDTKISLSPSLITLKTSLKKLDFVFTILQKDIWENEVEFSSLEQENNQQILKSFGYKNQGGERWFGLGCSLPISDKTSFGLSHFWTFLNNNYRYNLTSETLNSDSGILDSFFSENLNLQFKSQFSMVSKLGFSHQFKKNRIGFVVTTPNYLPLSNKASFEKTTVSLEDEVYDIKNIVDYSLKPKVKKAWQIDLGYSKIFSDSTTLWVNASYNSAVKPYTIFTVANVGNNPLALKSELKNTFNFSIGFAKQLKDHLHFLSSIRSNLITYKNKESKIGEERIYILDDNKVFVSAGFQVTHKKSSFVLGLDWGATFEGNDELFAYFPNIDLFERTPSQFSHNTLTFLVTYEFFIGTVRDSLKRSK